MPRFSSLLIPFALGVGFGIVAFSVILMPALTAPTAETLAGITYAPTAWKTFTSSQFLPATSQSWSYTLSYPRDMEVRTGDAVTGTSLLQSHPVDFALPDDAFDGDGTNFAGAWVTVDYATDRSSARCLTVPNADGTTVIDGVTFTTGTQAEAAAGNLYTTTIYRAMMSGVCVEVMTTLHTTNVGNYDPGTVTEFDTSKTGAIFGALLQHLTFALATADE